MASVAEAGGAAEAPGVVQAADTVVAGPTRVLCLGNELVADDALGILAARRLSRRLAAVGRQVAAAQPSDPALSMRVFEVPGVGRVEIVRSALTGLYLLEAVLGAHRLIVVDTVLTGAAVPGTVVELRESDLGGPRGGSPHAAGLLETLELARGLGLEAPDEVAFVAVEAGDTATVGGEMTAPVEAALSEAVDRTMALVRGGVIGSS